MLNMINIPFLSADAYSWMHYKLKERDEFRLKLKKQLDDGNKTIDELLEFDADLYD
jgi:hypothetical protein